MRKFVLPMVAVLIGMFAITLNASPASAQATRTWISGTGDDGNVCSRTAPCRTFAGAFAKTLYGGEIDCLDPGGFDTLTITHAITLDCGYGQPGSILTNGNNGITVNAGPNDVVIIRNVQINGNQYGSGAFQPGVNGIVFNSGLALIVQHCDIFDFISSGVAVTPSNNARAVIDDSHFSNTAENVTNAAILIRPTGGVNANVTIDNVHMDVQYNGIFLDGSGGGGIIHAQVRNSVITSSTNN